MVDIVEGKDGNHEQFRSIIHAAVEQAMGYRETDEEKDKLNQHIDDRIDRKFDKFKLWMFGVVVAALISMAGSVIAVVWFASGVDSSLESLGRAQAAGVTRVEFDAFKSETERRLDSKNERITRLENER